ncbi:amino acid adenylation domain-containing protein [Phytomonospora sp. NPDC050363]|uniref:amino acid adenylation domain-containing protein n=1 Tax=Phytomonospora sp. NPDC050363 TaxID=3155642 RepID=UPI0033EF2F3E
MSAPGEAPSSSRPLPAHLIAGLGRHRLLELVLSATALVAGSVASAQTLTVHIGADGRTHALDLPIAEATTLGDLRALVAEGLRALGPAPTERTEWSTVWDVDAEPVTPGGIRVDLHLGDGEARLTVAAGRAGDRIDFAAAVLDRILRAAELTATRPDLARSDADPVPASERDTLLTRFSPGRPAHERTTVVELWRRALRRDPAATFLIDGDTRLTYAEADARVDVMSRRLSAAGVGHGDRVAVCAHPSAATVLALFAAMRIGAAYVPVDPGEPRDRRAYILGDVAPVAVVTDLDDLESPFPVLPLRDLAADGPAPGGPAAAEPAPEDPIYVMYTSGTTGKPKGAVLTHAGVANLLLGLVDRIGLSPADTVLFHTRFSFDASVSELLLPVAAGMTVVVAPSGRDVENLAELVERHRVTLVSMVPSVIGAFLELTAGRPTLDSVATVFSVGEALPLAVAHRFHQATAARGSRARLENLYGPTEASVFATGTSVGSDAVRISIGRPLDGMRVHVLTPEGHTVTGVGVPGEICIAGTGVGLGYLNRPELNAGKFVPDPFGEGTMYRTGDIGRWLPSGELDYLGRVDDQVKVRGHRIELGDVETALAALPGVEQAACCAITADGTASLHALLVTGDPALVYFARALMTEHVPSHMVPSTFTRVDALPRNANGKLDRKALAALVERRPRETGEAPSGADAELLAAAVGRVLGVGPVLADDTFLEVGGDSLTAVLVVAELRRNGRELALASLLGGRTIGECARELAAEDADGDDEWRADGWEPLAWRPDLRRPAPALSAEERRHVLEATAPHTVEAVLPVTPMQEGIAFGCAQDADGTAFIVQQCYDTGGDRFTPETLRAALDAVTAAHPALRVRMVEVSGGRLLQAVLAGATVPLTVLDADGPDDLAAVLRADRVRPFEIEGGPLARVTWVSWGSAGALVVTYHHLLLDGWSQDLIVRDLVRAHDGISPEAGDAERLVRGYGDAVRAQTWSAREVDAVHWSTLLSELDDAGSQSPRRSRRPDGTAIGSVSVPVAPALGSAVSRLAERLAVTVSAVVEAAWAVALQQYAGTRDVVYGKVVTGRDLPVPGLADTAALVINTVPVRARCEAGTTVAELVDLLYRQSLGSYTRSRGRLTEVLRAGGLAPGALQSLYLYESASEARSHAHAAGLVLRPGSSEQTGFELTLLAGDATGELTLTALYDGRAFAGADMTLMLRRVVRALETMTADPSAELRAVPAVLPGEFAADERPGTASRSRVEESFRAVAAAHPGRPALVRDDVTLTYARLDAESDRVAGALLAAGMEPGWTVGIPAVKSVEAFVALLGVVKAGGAYVPLDPKLPGERLSYLLSSSGARAVVADDRLRELCAGEGGPVVIDPGATVESTVDPVAGSPEDPLYVMYTSGTTGRPKGVVVPHRAVTRLVEDVDYVTLTPGSVVMQTGALDFDASTFEVWGAWLNGATLVLGEVETQLDTALLGAAIARHGVTHMWLTSSLFNMHVERDATVFAPLAELLIGGERLSPEHVGRFYAANPRTTLINGYGPTETTTFATTHRIERDFTSIPIGRPLPRTRVYVVGDDGRRGVGLPGELWIAGDGVALGYVNDPELTAERFVPDPYGPGLAYRSGDLVRWNDDGTVDYLGRGDDQVKIRGFRVEPDEVVAALGELPEVASAAVIARESTTGAKELVAFVVAPSTVDVQGLRGALAARLPSYAVPAEVRRLDALPLTSAGKVDRRALERISRERAAAHSPEPAGEPDAVRSAFAEVCGRAVMGPHDNFYEHGGDSLKAMRLVGLLRDAGFDIGLRDVLTAPTPAALGAVLASRTPAAVPQEAPPESSPSSPAPMPPAAVRVYSAYRQRPESLVNNVPFAVSFDGRIDRGRLEAFLSGFVARHESVHSGYDVRDGSFAQTPVPDAPFHLETAPTAGDTVERLRAFARPFRLERPPLLRAALVTDADRDTLLVDAHHIAFDGASLDVFLTELSASLSGAALPPPSSYPDFARSLAALDHTDDLAHWLKEFAEPPEPVNLALGTGDERTALGVVGRKLPTETRDALVRLAAAEQATPFMIYTAALAVLLQKYTMEEDLVIGTPVDNRTLGEHAGVVGMGVNTVALRVRPADDTTVGELLRQVRETTLAAFAHQGLPFDELLTALSAQGHPSARDLVRVMLAYRRSPHEEFSAGERTARLIGPLSLEAKFDVEFTVTSTPAGDALGLEYALRALDRDAAELMMTHFADILTALPGALDTPIADVVLD